MNCNQCQKHIETEGNLTPLFCPHCHKPWQTSPPPSPITDAPPQKINPFHPLSEASDELKQHSTDFDAQEKAIQELIQQEDTEDTRALVILGVAHSLGLGTIEINLEKAQHFYKKAFRNVSRTTLDTMRYYLQTPMPQEELYHCLALLHIKSVNGDPAAILQVAFFATLNHPHSDFLDLPYAYTALMSQKNNPQSLAPLALCYRYGIGTEIAPEIAMDILKNGANNNEPHCLYLLAKWHREGNLLPFDYAKALHYAKLSAETGFAPAQVLLGHMTLCGEGTKENANQGLKYWKLSSSLQGDLVEYLSPITQIIAPIMYPTGITIESLQALREAFPHVPYFHHFQGKLYEKQENLPKAIECYEEAAKNNFTLSLYQLAKLEEHEQTKISPDSPPLQINTTALSYHQQAANQGYAPSQTQVAKYYLATNPDTQDIPLALKFLEKACQQEDGEASFQLGIIHLQGIASLSQDPEKELSLPINKEKALQFFQNSFQWDYYPAKSYALSLEETQT